MSKKVIRLFPYEMKAVRETLRGLEDVKVEPVGVNRSGEVIPNTVFFFVKELKKFFVLSAKRFMERNYESVIKINDFTCLTRFLECIPPYYECIEWKEYCINNMYYLNPDAFYETYPEADTEASRSLIDNQFKLLQYCLLYNRHPEIRFLLDGDYKDFVGRYMDAYIEVWDELLINKGTTLSEMSGLSDDYLQLAMKQEVRYGYLWSELRELYREHGAGIEDVEYLNSLLNDYYYDDGVISNELENINMILRVNKKSLASLLEYLKRCEKYQGLEAGHALEELSTYYYDAAKIDIVPEAYPSSLRKRRNLAHMTVYKLYDAIHKTEFGSDEDEQYQG